MRVRISNLTPEQKSAWKIKKQSQNVVARIGVVAAGGLCAFFADNKGVLKLLLGVAILFLIYAVYVTLADRIAGVDITTLGTEDNNSSSEQ